MVNVSDHTKCISLSSHLCMTRPTLINLNTDGYKRVLSYYLFMVNLDRFNRDVDVM